MPACPVCKFSAKEIEKDFFYGKTYLCPRHGEFDVTLQVLESPIICTQVRTTGRPRCETPLKKPR